MKSTKKYDPEARVEINRLEALNGQQKQTPKESTNSTFSVITAKPFTAEYDRQRAELAEKNILQTKSLNITNIDISKSIVHIPAKPLLQKTTRKLAKSKNKFWLVVCAGVILALTLIKLLPMAFESTVANLLTTSGSSELSATSLFFDNFVPDYQPSTQNTLGNYNGNTANSGIIAQQGDWIYYVNYNVDGCLYKSKLDGSDKQKLNSDPTLYINVVGDWIYYQLSQDPNNIYKIRTDGSLRTCLNSDISWSVSVIGDWVYYKNNSDNQNLYKMKTDGSSRTMINDQSVFSNIVADGWIYYQNSGDLEYLYKIRVDGTDRQLLAKDKAYWLKVVDEWIYYQIGAMGKIYKIKTDGTGRKIVFDGKSWDFNVSSGWIFFRNSSDHGYFYKIKTDGTQKSKINNDKPMKISIIADWVYYQSDDSGFMRTRFDGSERQLVE